jgi:hypothetical protein
MWFSTLHGDDVVRIHPSHHFAAKKLVFSEMLGQQLLLRW